MSVSPKRAIALHNQQITRAVCGTVLAVLCVTLAGAWSEGRWPNAAGDYITVWGTDPAGIDLLWRLRQIDGVARAVAVLRGDLPEHSESTGWREVALYANQADAADLAFLPPDPMLRLYRGHLPAQDDPQAVLLGYELAEALRLDVADRFTIGERYFSVAGIWSPSSRLSGNFAQVSAAVAENLALSLHLNHLTVVPAGGYKATETAWRIWQRMPDVQVLSPDWELAQARRERTALGLTFAGALLLAVLLSGPLWAEVAPRREMPKIPAAFAAGIVGFVAGWSIVQMVNAYCGHTLGLTPLQITPRLAAVVLALGTGLGLFTWQPFARWRRPLHYVVVILALAMCSAAQVAVGTLHGSLRLSLNLAQRVATDWVTLHGARADSILLRDIARLPGIRGYAIEAYGGPANENDERWLGPLPASGLVYGLQLAGGEGTLSVPYRLGLWQGRPLQAEALHEAVIGFDLAQKWGLRVGDSLAIRDVMFTIVGIRNRLPYDPANSVNQRIDISLESLRRVWPESLATAEVTLLTPPAKRQEDKAVYLQEVASRLNAEPFTIAERLAEMARGYPATWTITRSTPQTTVRHAIGVYTAVRILFTVLLLAIGALVVAGAVVGQLATDESRVSMLQALGASESHLLGEYVQRAAVLGTVGTLLGLLGGYAVSVLLNRLGPAGSAELLFTPQLAASVFFLTVLTAMFAAVGPVIRTIRQDVAATLYTSSADNHVPAPSTIGVAPGGSQS